MIKGNIPRYDNGEGPFYYSEFLEFYKDKKIANIKWNNAVPCVEYSIKNSKNYDKLYNSKHIRIANSKKKYN